MAVRFDNTIITRIQQANDIIELISEYISLKKKGKEMVGLCPFHEDHSPSLNISAQKQIFKCFACGVGGDVFKFVQMRDNLTFPQAVERLAQRVGINLEPAEFAKHEARKPSSDINPNKLAKLNGWAAKHFQDNLRDVKKGEKVREYLAERKISNESIVKWRLGLSVSDGGLVNAAKEQKIPLNLLSKAGLITSQIKDKFTNRLMFPISDVTGRIIGFGGRTLDGSGAKYINSPTTVLFDKSNTLYGLEHAREHIVKTGQVLVVEGYTDCIMPHQFGFANAVATLGTSFTQGQGRIVRRYAKKIVLIYDSDVAGIEAANRALDVCLSGHIDIKIATVPEGKDPCDFLLSAGEKKFKQMVDSAVDVLEFKWHRMTNSLERDETILGRKSAIEDFLQSIASAVRTGKLRNLEKGLIINKLSRIVGLDSQTINIELNTILRRTERNAAYSIEKPKVAAIDFGQGLLATAQREILEVLLNKPVLFDIVKQKITVESFNVPILRQIAVILFETLKTGENISLADILAKSESVEAGNCIVELAQAGEQKGNFPSRLKDALDAIQKAQKHSNKSNIKTMESQTRFLRNVYDNTTKQNRHSTGMV